MLLENTAEVVLTAANAATRWVTFTLAQWVSITLALTPVDNRVGVTVRKKSL